MSEPVTIKLEQPDAQLLTFIQTHSQAIFSGTLSTIALKQGHTVTENTQFKLNDQFTELTITELEPPTEDSPVKEAK